MYRKDEIKFPDVVNNQMAWWVGNGKKKVNSWTDVTWGNVKTAIFNKRNSAVEQVS